MTSTIEPADLPETVRTYLAQRYDAPAVALEAFMPDAVVVDDGNTYRGHAAIGAWMASSGTAYEFTVTFLRARTDGDDLVVTNRLEGNFPGGLVDLDFRFVLAADGAIRELTIAP